jgi:hypothetical protein
MDRYPISTYATTSRCPHHLRAQVRIEATRSTWRPKLFSLPTGLQLSGSESPPLCKVVSIVRCFLIDTALIRSLAALPAWMDFFWLRCRLYRIMGSASHPSLSLYYSLLNRLVLDLLSDVYVLQITMGF